MKLTSAQEWALRCLGTGGCYCEDGFPVGGRRGTGEKARVSTLEALLRLGLVMKHNPRSAFFVTPKGQEAADKILAVDADKEAERQRREESEAI